MSFNFHVLFLRWYPDYFHLLIGSLTLSINYTIMFHNSAETPLRATSGQKDVKNRFLANCHVDDGGGDDEEEEDEDKC